ncbi:6-pyruvoyl trahydropterin synthase family protein [Simiduia aestuariiviva]|uniref:6-carboxy-5,6,7,8-tetrahydropterin synthase n=1 Tax=Simiduia aestuariiviva TaxID=1510459 RepID=A0A839UKG5_9GAMM|nr:6-carboxytetrahydropterin synthase [Simiduia aestuariiviva]MBB3168123.1 6-pyruvoyltetrahydropterin/6-carboxytetrahydropterin synthase [Simiduia aestuariiviva]
MSSLTTIEVNKEDMKFSAAHFTIFSGTERERLHGHNFRVSMSISSPANRNGLAFSYKILKDKIRALCDELDEYTLLPAKSPYLAIVEQGSQYQASFNGETLVFLKSDCKLLPIPNTTVEAFADYLLQRFLHDDDFVSRHDIAQVEMKVSSGPGQWGSCIWREGI